MRGSSLAALATLAVLTVVAPAVATADIKAGVDAWARGDYTKAVEEWRGPAVAGDADAQFNMGQAYKLGRGVPVDPALAESWFRKAALQGHTQAQDNYGLALFQADRKADAVPWLEKSVARFEPRAQLVLGTMLFNGDGVERNWPRAYALMMRASAAGLPSASQTLAQMDQYISPADREKGTALAQQYATQARTVALSPAPEGPIGLPAATKPAAKPAARPTPAPAESDKPKPQVAAKPTPRKPAPTPAKTTPTKTADAKPAPTPKPAAKPAPAKADGGKWRVQLGAFKDRANAEALWKRVSGRMTGASPSYVAAGGFTRLQAGGYASKADAARACTAAKAADSPCVVVAP